MIKQSVLLVAAMATVASAKWTGKAPSTRQTSTSATCAAARGQDTHWTTTSFVVSETTACFKNEHDAYQTVFDCDTMVVKSKVCTGGNAADWCSGTCKPIDGDEFSTSGVLMELGDSSSCFVFKNPTTKAVAHVDVVKSVTNTEGNYWGEMAKLCAQKTQGWVGAAGSVYVANETKCDSSALLNGAPLWTTSHMLVTKDTSCAMNEHGIYKNTYECTGSNTYKRKAGHTCTGGTWADPCSGSCTTPIATQTEDEEISQIKPCAFDPKGASRTTVKADVKGDYWEEGNKLCPQDSPSPAQGSSAAPSAVPARVTLTVVLSMLAVLLGSH